MRVALDVFSGRPNPSWALSGRDGEALLDRFAGRAMPGVADADPVLGYRGFIVTAGAAGLRRAGLAAAFRVGTGEPQPAAARTAAAGGSPPDEDDALWLLATARRAVGDDLAAYVEDAIRSPAEPSQREAATRAGHPPAAGGAERSVDCTIRNAPFVPGFWNQPSVMPYNNCYNYAMNYRSNSFAQPGRISGHQFDRITCEAVRAAARHDGCAAECSGVAKQVALVVWPNVDFHWYRNHSNGFWGHKIGPAPATNLDNLNHVIDDAVTPEHCAREPYTDFCGFLHPPLWLPVI